MENNIVATKSYKIYKIKRSKLEERLDVDYYHPSHYQLLDKLSKSKFKILPLSKIADRIFDGPFGSSVKSDDYVQEGIPFIRVADITHGEGTIYNNNLIYISKDKHFEIIRSKIVSGDIVIAKTGATMGAASIVPSNIPEANIRGDLAGLAIYNNPDLSQYICNYINTDLGYSLFWRLNSGATRGRVVLGNLKKFPVIIPDKSTIKKINHIYKEGRNSKAQKLLKANSILESINNYLLSELDIKIPVVDNSLESRVFSVKLSSIVGSRLDPINIKARNHTIKGGRYKNLALGQIAYVKKGQSITKDKIIEGKYPVIAGGQSSPYSHNIFNNAGNTITVSASGAYSGYVWYHDTPIFASDCSAINSKDENLIKTKFIAEVLKLKQLEIYSYQQGSGQPHVYPSDLKKTIIPIPSIEKQNEMLIHISGLRKQAGLLVEEATLSLENAKTQIESIILQS